MIKKYAGLFAAFFKISAIADLEYRANLAVKIFTDLLWYCSQIAVFEVLYLHTPQLAGWNVHQLRVFMGIMFLVDAIYMVIFHENLDQLPEKVRKGELDLLLVKPVNSQFMLSCNRFSTAYIGNAILLIAWTSWALAQLPDGIPWARLPFLLIVIPCGVLTIYCLRLFFTGVTLIFTQANAIVYIWYQVYRLGTRPDRIYPPILRYAVLTVIPVGFIASVPARVLLDPADWTLIAAPPLVAAALLYTTTRYWRFALRHYSSASS